MKRFLPLLALIPLFISSCAMKQLSLNVMKPAQINVPSHVKRVVILNRAQPKSKLGNILEGVLTGETIGQDKAGIEEALNGLDALLKTTDRYEVVRATEMWEGSGTGGNFPQAISWSEVRKMCDRYNADALIALETFDSDFIITNGSKQTEEKGPDGNTRKVTTYTAEGVASVKLGFRMYDPVKLTLIDQEHFSQNRTWGASGSTPTAAAAALIQRKEAVKRCSYTTGNNYGKKISPNFIRVSRGYFKKAKGNVYVEQGARMAEVGDWRGAAEMWQKASNQGDQKAKGRATYNLAVANEVVGNLDEAKTWAQKAYSIYGEKKARSYVAQLDARIWDRERLKEQMGDE